jgi:hypothetical protein
MSQYACLSPQAQASQKLMEMYYIELIVSFFVFCFLYHTVSSVFFKNLFFFKTLTLFIKPNSTHSAFYIFTTLLTYLAIEWIACCVLIEGYMCSLFSVMDFVVVLAVVTDAIEYCGLIKKPATWMIIDVSHLSGLTILRSSRMATLGARVIRIFKLNIERVMELTGHKKKVTGVGLSAQYGVKGYEDESNVAHYIKEKFTFAFHEAENQGKVERENFTMMLRNLLSLELELEEEDVRGRVFTCPPCVIVHYL